MPKLKTHKGAKRRFHITGTGKVMHRKGSISHLRTRKSKPATALARQEADGLRLDAEARPQASPLRPLLIR